MTRQLYYEDTYASAFQAVVTDCQKADGCFWVTLDQTLFYPEGGGQPADHGTLNGIAVTDVQEKDGEILHQTEEALAIGTKVQGNIDWGRRFDLMQNHSGEHIISGVICETYHCDNVGFHMGADNVTIDFNHKIPTEDLPLLEQRANEAIYRNILLAVSHPSPQELQELPYRSKKELTGDVRIVTAEGYDCCACCGLHVSHAGQIGIIKILSAQNYKGGTRIELVCGSRALRDYREKNDTAAKISHLLSVPPAQIGAAAEALKAERDLLKKQLSQLKYETFRRQAAALPKETANYLCFADGIDGKDLIHLGDLFAASISGTAAVFTETPNGYRFLLFNRGAEVNALLKEMQACFGCKGGGKPNAVQGNVTAKKEDLVRFFAEKGFAMEETL